MTQIHDRVRAARLMAGFDTTKAAVDRFGWSYPTYAAHENGSRVPKRPALERYAEAFGVELRYLLLGFDTEQQRAVAQVPTRGRPANVLILPELAFNESDGDFLQSEQYRTLTNSYADIAIALVPDVLSTSFFICSRNLHPFFLHIGDVLICDTEAPTKAGDTIIIKISDPETNETSTQVAAFYPPFFLPSKDGRTMTKLDSEVHSVLAKVVASFRQEYN